MSDTALFEIDLKSGLVTFVQAGPLEGFLETHRPVGHDESLAAYLDAAVYPDDRAALYEAFCYEGYLRVQRKGETTLSGEYRALSPQTGEYEWYSLNAMLTRESTRAVGTILNIHQSKLADLEKDHLADHDLLTGLLNRTAFERAVNRLTGGQAAVGCCLLLELDYFQMIHQTRSQRQGEQLLLAAANLLRVRLPADSVICRWGEDAFCILLPQLCHPEQASRLAERLLDELGRLEDFPDVAACIGISFYPEDGRTLQNGLVQSAKVALYRVKNAGKSGFCVYDPEMGKQISYQSAAPGYQPAPQKKSRPTLQLLRPVITGVLTLGGCIVLLLFCANSYIQKLERMVDEESFRYLDEISTQISSGVLRLINSDFDILHALSRTVQRQKDWPLSRLTELLDGEKESYGFSQLVLIDANGSWHSKQGVTSPPNGLVHAARLQREQTPFVSEMYETNDDTGYTTFFYPMPPTRMDGVTIVGIGAVASIEQVNQLLPLTLFGGQGYAHVVSNEGKLIIRSNHARAQLSGNDLFEYFKGIRLQGITAAQIRQDFKDGVSRRIGYFNGQEEIFATYIPMHYKNWYLVTIIPASLLTASTGGFYRLTITACGVMCALFILLLLLFIAAQWRGKRALARMAYVDPVTGGSSKGKFDRDVAQILKQRPGQYSMLYVNVDRFKLINDHFGKQTGDRLLRHICAVFDRDLGANERAARLMADHFGLLVHTQELSEIRRRMEYWNREIIYFSRLSEELYRITLSYGVYPVDEPQLDVSLLIDRANLARKMIAPDTREELRYAVYDKRVKQQMGMEKELEDRQEQALENGEFIMYLQPKYDPYTNQIAGAEALARWTSPDRGIIFPNHFIPLFESNGFITKLDLFMFGEACRFIWRLIDAGLPPIPISVNLSRVHLYNAAFLSDYLELLAKYPVDTSLIEFEITETLMLESFDLLHEVIARIHSYGFRVSMDDFGSGYSSLNMLKNIDMDVVKLDRNFFGRTGDSSERGRLIVRHIIDLARDLQIEVVAEGVEEEEQVEYLREYGCHLIQGYYYARAQPADHVFNMLAQHYSVQRAVDS